MKAVLPDDIGFFPPYYACNFVRQETLDKYPELEQVLSKLDGRIDEKTMAEMNSKVDVEGKSAEEVAHQFLEENGLLGR